MNPPRTQGGLRGNGTLPLKFFATIEGRVDLKIEIGGNQRPGSGWVS